MNWIGYTFFILYMVGLIMWVYGCWSMLNNVSQDVAIWKNMQAKNLSSDPVKLATKIKAGETRILGLRAFLFLSLLYPLIILYAGFRLLYKVTRH